MDEKLQAALTTIGWSVHPLTGQWTYARDPSGSTLVDTEVEAWVQRNPEKAVRGWLKAHPGSRPRDIAVACKLQPSAVTKILKRMYADGEAVFNGQGRGTTWRL